jgi:hypothetical protein
MKKIFYIFILSVLFIGKGFAQNNENKISKLKYNFSMEAPFENSKLLLKNIVLRDSLLISGFECVDESHGMTFIKKGDFQNMVGFELVSTIEQKKDCLKQTNEASNDEDYKQIKEGKNQIIYTYRTQGSSIYEIQGIKIINGEMIAIMAFLKISEADIEHFLKKYLSYVKL